MFSFQLQWMKSYAVKLTGTIGLCVLVCIVSSTNGLASELPENSFRRWTSDRETFPIPGGMGIEYFYGEWHRSLRGGPITITPDKIWFLESYHADLPWLYRVLFEGRDYVLIVHKPDFGERPPRAQFGVFLLMNREQTVPGYLNNMTLSFLECTDVDMQSPEPFEWSNERLIDEFLTQCGSERTPDDELLLFRGWSGDRFIREMPKYGYPDQD